MAERYSTGHLNAECNGGIKSAYANGVIGIYGGATIPTDLDGAIPGTLLCLVTKASGSFSPGTATNGINFDNPAAGIMSKAAAENWSGTVLEAAGAGTTATFYVHYANDMTTGASTTAVRMAGQISTSPTIEMPIANPLVAGAPFVIASYAYKPQKVGA